MSNIKINLRGDVREFPAGVTGFEVAQSIGAGLAKAACAVSVNGEVRDLRLPINEDCELSVLTFDDADGKHAYWHSTSHVMAQAIQHLYPQTLFTIGPAIENGFYYDIDCDVTFTPEILEKIEDEMRKICKEKLSFIMGHTGNSGIKVLAPDFGAASCKQYGINFWQHVVYKF